MSELTWRTSSRCLDGSCLAVANDGARILLRDDKQPDGPVLRFTREQWRTFLPAAVLFDGDEVDTGAGRVMALPPPWRERTVCIADPQLAHLHVSEADWAAFAAGAKAGEFDDV